MKRILLLLLCFNFSYIVFGCSCINVDYENAYNMSDLIFVGEVVSVEKDYGFNINKPKQLKVKMILNETFKGQGKLNMDFYTSDNSASCGYNFEVDEKYLVYSNIVDDKNYVSLCSRTQKFNGSENDIAFLKNMNTSQNILKDENNYNFPILILISVFIVIFGIVLSRKIGK